jgi:large subunit ribosomal protein L22
MEARAEARQVRISPLKVRQMMQLVHGKSVDKALLALRFTRRRPLGSSRRC